MPDGARGSEITLVCSPAIPGKPRPLEVLRDPAGDQRCPARGRAADSRCDCVGPLFHDFGSADSRGGSLVTGMEASYDAEASHAAGRAGARCCAVEAWWYDPAKLANGGVVDPLSLSLSFQQSEDERIEAAVEEMIQGMQW